MRKYNYDLAWHKCKLLDYTFFLKNLTKISQFSPISYLVVQAPEEEINNGQDEKKNGGQDPGQVETGQRDAPGCRAEQFSKLPG